MRKQSTFAEIMRKEKEEGEMAYHSASPTYLTMDDAYELPREEEKEEELPFYQRERRGANRAPPHLLFVENPLFEHSAAAAADSQHDGPICELPTPPRAQRTSPRRTIIGMMKRMAMRSSSSSGGDGPKTATSLGPSPLPSSARASIASFTTHSSEGALQFAPVSFFDLETRAYSASVGNGMPQYWQQQHRSSSRPPSARPSGLAEYEEESYSIETDEALLPSLLLGLDYYQTTPRASIIMRNKNKPRKQRENDSLIL